MKLYDLIFVVVLVTIAAAGWQLYRKHFMFKGEDEALVLRKLSNMALIINSCAKKLDIDPRLLVSVIYAERRMNVNLVDSFEHIYAGLGYNSSIGLAQIRVNTAKWIMKMVLDSTSGYFLNQRYHKWLPSYESDDTVIKLLKEDSTNCMLAAFHLRQIMQRWKDAGFNIGAKPDIIMTLYSYGLYHREDGTEIVPHGKPQSNFLGKVAASFFYSAKLRGQFP